MLVYADFKFVEFAHHSALLWCCAVALVNSARDSPLVSL